MLTAILFMALVELADVPVATDDPSSCSPLFQWLCISACDEEANQCYASGRSWFYCVDEWNECVEFCNVLSGCDG